jgi:hypothetical protein
MENLAKAGIVIAVVIVVAIFAYTMFGSFFESPQAVCGQQGMVYDATRDICVPAGGIGASCAPFVSSGQCQYGLSCGWDINPLVLFRSCQGTLQYPMGG